MYQWQKNRAKGKRGFTLIELIVVMAILAILAMLLVPMIGTYTKKARDATGNANARAVYAAAAAWAADRLAFDDLNGSISVDGPDLKEYFSNTNGAKISAQINKDGSVEWAKYNDYKYPPEPKSK